MGNFPPGWMEWNDKFRDISRAFWKGDDEGRPAELGRQIGRLQREASRSPERLEGAHLDEHTRANLARYLAEQRAATGVVPDEATVVVERFRDELGDWRVVVHSPLAIVYPSREA